jgi:hypothetical protein
MPYPSTLYGRATSEKAIQLFPGSPAHRADGLRLSSTPLDTPRRTPTKAWERQEQMLQPRRPRPMVGPNPTEMGETWVVFRGLTEPICTVRPAGGDPWFIMSTGPVMVVCMLHGVDTKSMMNVDTIL